MTSYICGQFYSSLAPPRRGIINSGTRVAGTPCSRTGPIRHTSTCQFQRRHRLLENVSALDLCDLVSCLAQTVPCPISTPSLCPTQEDTFRMWCCPSRPRRVGPRQTVRHRSSALNDLGGGRSGQPEGSWPFRVTMATRPATRASLPRREGEIYSRRRVPRRAQRERRAQERLVRARSSYLPELIHNRCWVHNARLDAPEHLLVRKIVKH